MTEAKSEGRTSNAMTHDPLCPMHGDLTTAFSAACQCDLLAKARNQERLKCHSAAEDECMEIRAMLRSVPWTKLNAADGAQEVVNAIWRLTK